MAQKVAPYPHGQRSKRRMRGKGRAPSCASYKPVFPVFFVRASPQNNQKMPKLTKTGYFWEILGSHTVKLVRKLTELV